MKTKTDYGLIGMKMGRERWKVFTKTDGKMDYGLTTPKMVQ